jgi:ABC-type transporter Mla subunit MlaD
MDMIVDFLLLAASAGACFFCFVLSRRLKALSSAEKGLGAGIAQLSVSAEEVKAAVSGSKSMTDAAAARIEQLLALVEEKSVALEALLAKTANAGDSVVGQTEDATQRYVETLAPFLEEANAAANRLFAALERIPGALSGAPAAPADDPQELEFIGEPSPAAAKRG